MKIRWGELIWSLASILLFWIIVSLKTHLIIQTAFLLIPFLLTIKWGLKPGIFSAFFLSIIFVRAHPPSEETLHFYLVGIVLIILSLILGNMVRILRLRSRKLEALYRAAQVLASTKNSDELSMEISNILKNFLGYQHAVVSWVKGEELELAYSEDYILKKGFKIKIGEGITGTAVKERKTILIGDVKKHKNYIPGLPGARSELATPIIVGGNVIGVINIEDRRKNAFTVEDQQLLEAFAKMVAVAWENVQLHEKLLMDSITDPLTGLYNRRFLFKRLEEEIDRARRYKDNFGVLMFDLTNFKAINDTYGHERGDELLQKFARILRTSLRKSDIVARYGGDEFVAIILDARRDGLTAIMKRISEKVKENFSASGIPIGVNIGGALYPWDGKTVEELLKIADKRMYDAKKQGVPFLVIL